MSSPRTRLFALALFVCLAGHSSVAQRTKPQESDSDAVKEARAVVDAMPADRRLLVNGLRYLMRPAYEPEIMDGTQFTPCKLGPFEDEQAGPITLPEMLRLWAVLQSGLAQTPALERQIRRFIETPQQKGRDTLAPYAVVLGVCRELSLRPGAFPVEDYKALAQGTFDAAMRLKDATDAKSSLISASRIDARWYSNHLWRGLMYRCAISLGLEHTTRGWENDLKVLASVCRDHLGWPCDRGDELHHTRDLSPNLTAIAALSLAVREPKVQFPNAVQRTLEQKSLWVPHILARLEADYPWETMQGGRLALISSFEPRFAPKGKSGEEWQKHMLETTAIYEPTGALYTGHGLARDLGLIGETGDHHDAAVAETALACIAVSGGLYRVGVSPLAGVKLAEVAQAMHALTVMHAHIDPPPPLDGFDEAVRKAIVRGCEYFAHVQLANGSIFENRAMTCFALLAMLHGGWERESGAIRQGLEWVLQQDWVTPTPSCTYEAAPALMFLEMYHRPAIEAAGMLTANTKEQWQAARDKLRETIPQFHRDVGKAIVTNLDASHLGDEKCGWGYSPTSKPHHDNSNSQFAMLGYRSASLMSVDLDARKILMECKRLLRQYHPLGDGPVKYEHLEVSESGNSIVMWKGKVTPGGWDYSTMKDAAGMKESMQLTGAGMSSLVICRDELKVRGMLDEETEREIALTLHGAQVWLAGKYYKRSELTGNFHLFKPEYWGAIWGRDGLGLFYNLWSVERGCVMANVKLLDEREDWYRIGAEGLIENQYKDGSWGRGSTEPIGTAMAILFLKRATPHVTFKYTRKGSDDPPPKYTGEPKPKPAPSPTTPGPGEK